MLRLTRAVARPRHGQKLTMMAAKCPGSIAGNFPIKLKGGRARRTLRTPMLEGTIRPRQGDLENIRKHADHWEPTSAGSERRLVARCLTDHTLLLTGRYQRRHEHKPGPKKTYSGMMNLCCMPLCNNLRKSLFCTRYDPAGYSDAMKISIAATVSVPGWSFNQTSSCSSTLPFMQYNQYQRTGPCIEIVL